MPDEHSSEIPYSSEKGKTVVSEPHYPVRWPHEEGRLGKAISFMGRAMATRVMRQFTTSENSVESSRVTMRKINGEGSEILADKFHFTEVVRKLGYTAPLQGLALAEQMPEQRIRTASMNFHDGEQKVICKPYNGKGGAGIVEMKVGDLPDFLSTIGQDYIVQEKVPIRAEIRYVRNIDEEAQTNWRVYDEKEIPKLRGDGKQTKRQLIRRSDLPLSSKVATGKQNLGSLGTVVAEGGSIHVSRIGVPEKEELEWRPGNRQRVGNMDRFMKQFLTDLQTEIGHPLPLLCFDIGVKDMSVLDKEYDFEAIKQNLVPFECQMPFGIGGYLSRSRKDPEGKGSKVQ